MEIGDLPNDLLLIMQQALAEVGDIDLDEQIIGPVVLSTPPLEGDDAKERRARFWYDRA
jgi:hypothetical protein